MIERTDNFVGISFCPVRSVSAKGFWIFLVLIALSFTGCGGSGPRTYSAGGQVKYPDGTPLPTGSVMFRLTNGERSVTARGEVQSDGTFKLTTFNHNDGAIPGLYKVSVTAAAAPPPNVRTSPTTPVAPPPLVDPRFSSFETSKLEFTVTDDTSKNQFDITVTKPK